MEPEPDRTIFDFWKQLLDDLERGDSRSLDHYIEMFPHGESTVRDEWKKLEAGRVKDRFGPRYEVRGRLGSGGQGAVFLAYDRKLQREVAIKSLDSSWTGHERFEQEARVGAKAQIEGVCRVYDADLEADPPFIVMEYVRGKCLKDLLTEGLPGLSSTHVDLERSDAAAVPPPPVGRESAQHRPRSDLRAIIRIVETVARNLHAVHEADVVHRDIKPENIIVKPDGTPVLLDWGLAKVIDEPSMTTPGQAMGTKPYMAPERYAGECDRRTDVFALGVVLYRATAGRFPFPGRSIDDVDPRPLPRATNADLAAVTFKAIEKERSRRYATASDLAEDLRSILGGQPVKARPPSAARRCRRWLRRNRLRVAAAVATLLVVVLLRYLGHVWKVQSITESAKHLQDWQHERVMLYPAPERRGDYDDYLGEADEILASLDGLSSWGALIPRWDEACEASSFLTGDVTESGSILEMERRRDISREIRQATIDQPRRLWNDCAERMRANPRYEGMSPLPPQCGLIPLGRDKKSGLEEFLLWTPRTRALERGPKKSLGLGGGAFGVVLVLIPGATFELGAHEYDKWAQKGEKPASEVHLDAFFISKFEISCWQYQYVFGVSSKPYRASEPGTEIGHADCWVLARWNLRLPTEAQWEWAARGGESRVFMIGDEPESLVGHANLGREFWENLGCADDGFGKVAPVHHCDSNGYGLHGIIGNVWEWCLDEWSDSYRGAAWERGSGLRTRPRGSREHILRGGCYQSSDPRHVRPTNRNRRLPGGAHDCGIRPVMQVRLAKP